MKANTISLWKSITNKLGNFAALTKDVEADVLIIGGGITGLVAAYNLAKADKRVVIVEKDNIGEGTTGFSTGNLYVPVQPYYATIANKFNTKAVQQIIAARKEAIDHIEKITIENNFACHFQRRPQYIFTNDEYQIKNIEKERDLLRMGCDVHDVDILDIPLPFKRAIKINNQAKINPLKFTLDLADWLAKRGCEIYENTQAMDYEEYESHCIIHTQNHTIKAKNIFIATHVPFGFHKTQQFLGPYRSYVIAATLKSQNYPNGNYWDLASPHHAISTHSVSSGPDVNIIAIAGSHHKTGQNANAENNFTYLEQFLARYFDLQSVKYRWSAQHYQAADKIPFIGLASRASKRVFIATGFFADGLVYGAAAGTIVSGIILGKDNPYAHVFDSNRRTPLAKAAACIKENSNVFLQYMKDFPTCSYPNIEEQIKSGEGKIIERQGEKLAVSKDNDGQLHCVSAVCTHMKCIVAWNSAEKTWDCPCHGSRFSKDGKVLEGPAVFPLKAKDLR